MEDELTDGADWDLVYDPDEELTVTCPECGEAWEEAYPGDAMQHGNLCEDCFVLEDW